MTFRREVEQCGGDTACVAIGLRHGHKFSAANYTRGNESTNESLAASMLGGGHLTMQPSCNGSFTQLTPDPLKSLKPMSLGLRSVHAEQLRQNWLIHWLMLLDAG